MNQKLELTSSANSSLIKATPVHSTEPPDPDKPRTNRLRNVKSRPKNDRIVQVNEMEPRYSKFTMFILWGRELLCVLALILTTYASIQNG
jgi:hypothetical protein